MQKTLAVINLSNLVKNARTVRNLIGERKFYAVVKADGYGHGGAEIASALEDVVDGFCVAITDEGAALRAAGVTKPILVLTPPMGKDDIARSEFYKLQVCVNSAAVAKAAQNCECHIKVNTGMNRFGCNLAELPEILKILSPENICGVYSHLYDPSDRASALSQLKIFNRAEEIVKSFAPRATAHIAASGGILAGGEFLKDGARCGILLYGYPPQGFTAEVKPILKVYARLVQTTEFIGGGAGYAAADKNYENLNVYRLGYADGFSRTSPLGENNLCMDSFLRVGGKRFQLVMDDALAYAQRCGTIPYEALCAVTRRSERIYEE